MKKRIKLLSSLGGVDGEGREVAYQAGQVIEWEGGEAGRMVEAGIAEPAMDESKSRSARQGDAHEHH